MLILGGMLSALRGEERPELTEENAQEKADFAMLNEEDITFTFDTVFIVRKSGRSIEPFRRFLDGIGDSLVIGEDDEAFKVHVHTDIPGEALTEAQKYGTLELAKIENMRTQAQQLAAGGKAQSTDDLEAIEQELEAAEHENAGEAEPEKDFGFLAVCAGEGLANVFTDLGADGVISGGQTMNPSTESILKEIKKVPAHTVFVLPNNKNIIMAAQQCIGPDGEDRRGHPNRLHPAGRERDDGRRSRHERRRRHRQGDDGRRAVRLHRADHLRRAQFRF